MVKSKEEINILNKEVFEFYDAFHREITRMYAYCKVLAPEGIKMVREKYMEFEQKRIDNGLKESDYKYPPSEIKKLLDQHIKENKLEESVVNLIKQDELKPEFEHSTN